MGRRDRVCHQQGALKPGRALIYGGVLECGYSTLQYIGLSYPYISQSGYTQGANNVAEFDITKYLRPGENTLAVEVMRWSDGSYLECQDMFRMSGIFRDVELLSIARDSPP